MQWLTSFGPVGKVLYTIILVIEVLLVFNLMILVHEWGHFLAARWRGLKVEAFYIWFGKPLWKKTINGVEYGLGSIPAGGFVKLPQMAPMDAIEGASSSDEPLPPIKPLDKIIVAFAGPLFSFLLAVFFAFLVMWLGKPEGEDSRSTVIGYVAKESLAEKAGLKIGDVVKTVDGTPVSRFEGQVDSVRWAIFASEGETIHFQVQREGQPELLDFQVQARDKAKEKKLAWWEHIFRRPTLRDVGIRGLQTPTVGKIQLHSPAHEAGLKPGDQVLSANGISLLNPSQLGYYLSEEKPASVQLVVRREGQTDFTVDLAPRPPDLNPSNDPEYNRPMVGIEWDLAGKRVLNKIGVLTQISEASRAMYNTISKMVAANSDITPAQMSGPLGIGRVYFQILQDSYPLHLVLWFSVVLNINLAIMNMLPFPVLDGGHITIAAMEAIRRKPVHLRLLEVVQTVCVLALLGFFVFVSLKDVGDIFGVRKRGDQQEVQLPRWLPKNERPAAATPAP
jgi:regulator of sigma E protease